MEWKIEETEREIKMVMVNNFIKEMEENGERFGENYSVIREIYKKKSPLEIENRNGLGTLVEQKTGKIVAQDKKGKEPVLGKHIGHELFMGDFCCEEMIYVECAECREMIYDCPWNE